jgi:hypothetical protein
MKMTRLDILKNSLIKKEKIADDRLQNHFSTVREANGQPLNDKRNGRATLNKWERQNDSIRKSLAEIEKTKQAIEREESKVNECNRVNSELPPVLLEYMDRGLITQWRKYPNMFFVVGGGRARLIWKNNKLWNKYYSECTPDEKVIFKKIYNEIVNELNIWKKERTN